jgi:hypothetical protein
MQHASAFETVRAPSGESRRDDNVGLPGAADPDTVLTALGKIAGEV